MNEDTKNTVGVEMAYADLDEGVARSLLNLALTKPRPVEELLRMLGSLVGDAWFPSAMRSGLSVGLEEPEKSLLDGQATLDDLLSIKETCKVAMREGCAVDQRTRITLAYFLCIAAGVLGDL